jgi:HEAT repeat protein
MSATVKQLVAVRSSLTEAIKGYYKALIKEADRTPWHRKRGVSVSASAIAIRARVLKEDTRPKREPSPESDRDGYRKESPWWLRVDPNIAAVNEQPSGEKEESPWDQETLLLRRAVIVGGPGGGKTFLTQTTALELARQGLQELENRSTALDQLPLPIWIELNDLASEAGRDDLAKLLVALARRRCEAPALESWLRKSLPSNNCWLILDALDQVKPDYVIRLKRLLASVETQGWQGRMLVTCRKANYNRQDIPWVIVTEYEMAPFDPAEIAAFITRWHGEKDLRGEKLNAVVGRGYSLQQACRTPLVITLACLANEEKELKEDARRGELYAQVLRGLLRRAWHENPLNPQDACIDDMLEMLRRMAWELFVASPSLNQFANSQVKKAIAAGVRKAGLTRAVTRLRKESVDRGVPLRTLLDNMSWLPEWQEVITLLAGSLVDPQPLLELLRVKDTDDLFRHRLALAAQCLGELAGQTVFRDLVNDVTAQLWAHYWTHRYGVVAVEHITQALPALAKVNGEVKPQLRLITYVASLLRDPDVSVRHFAQETFSRMGPAAAHSDMVDRLVEWLRDPSLVLRSHAAGALGSFGPAAERREVLEGLLECLRDPQSEVRDAALCALAKIGPGAGRYVAEWLLEWLQNPEWEVHPSNDEALRKLRLGASRPQMLDRIAKGLCDPGWDVRYRAARMLRWIGPLAARADIVNSLQEWLHEGDSFVRCIAVVTLADLGLMPTRPDLADRLLECLIERDSFVRRLAEQTLARLWPAVVRADMADQLVELLRDPDRNVDVRFIAANMLAGLVKQSARPDVVERLLDYLRSPYRDVRSIAAYTFAKIGPAAARRDVVDELLEHLQDTEWEVQSSVANALGKFGPSSLSTRPDIIDRLLVCFSAWESVRCSVASALGQMAVPRRDVVDWLVQRLGDAYEAVRSSAAEALAQIGPSSLAVRPDVVDRLIACLDDEVRVHRMPLTAANALARIGAARPDVVARLVGCNAAEALGLMMDSGARFFLGADGVMVAWVKDLSHDKPSRKRLL